MMQRSKLLSTSLGLAITCLLLTGQSHGKVYPGQDQPKPYIIQGRLTIQFEDGVDLQGFTKGFGRVSFGVPSLDRILDDFEVSDTRKLFPWRTEKPPVNSGHPDLTRFYEISFPESIEVKQVINALMQNPKVRLAEAVWALPMDASPDDPMWPDQWAMEPPPPDPDFYDAWDLETGSDSIIVAIVDGGVNYNHPDLKGNIWVNSGEDVDGDGVVFDTDDLNGVDDDGNGVTDDLVGYDFLTGIGQAIWPGEDGNTRDPDPNDFHGHGTNVAGIAAAMTNNGTDVTGVAGGWFGGHRVFRGARIMCLRAGALAANGIGYLNSNDIAACIDYATTMGADVINNSWGGGSFNSAIQAAFNNAFAAGITIVKSAGNDNCDCPGAYSSMSGIIEVASVGPNSDVKSGFSNFGSWVEVSAPGSLILSTYSWEYVPGTATFNPGGTSMSAPMVAGLAALIRSMMPSLTKDQVDSVIINTADNIDSVNSPTHWGKLGSGRINAHKALIDLPNAKFTADVTEGNVPLLVQFTDQSPNSPSAWVWRFGTGDTSTLQDPSYSYTNPGIYSVSLLIDEGNPLGLGEEHLKNYIWASADTCILDSVQGAEGSKVVLPVYLANTAHIKDIQFAFSAANSIGVSLDSFSVVGLRTESFFNVQFNAFDPGNKRYSII